MSARPRQPTDDDSETEIFDSSRSKRVTQKQADVTGVTKVERRKAPTKQKHGAPIPHSEPPPARDRSEPIRVISMKAATEEAEKAERPMPKVQIRSLADVAQQRKATAPPVAMGYLAPPRDPKESRSRRRIDNVMWGCFAVILACGVTLAIWFLAR